MRGRFITVEGLDGAGKTTHLQWLRNALEQRQVLVTVTREPGGTALGETLRGVLLSPVRKLHAETEALLMFAARRNHLDEVILPALARGEWVLCDRFTDASFAYQSGGSGVPWEKIEALEQWVHPDLQPDLTIYFDIDPAIARVRASADRTPDRFEQEQHDFHAAVRSAYLRRVRENPHRMKQVDAGGALRDVEKQLERVLTSAFPEMQSAIKQLHRSI